MGIRRLTADIQHMDSLGWALGSLLRRTRPNKCFCHLKLFCCILFKKIIYSSSKQSSLFSNQANDSHHQRFSHQHIQIISVYKQNLSMTVFCSQMPQDPNNVDKFSIKYTHAKIEAFYWFSIAATCIRYCESRTKDKS